MYIPSNCVISPAVLLHSLFVSNNNYQAKNIFYFSYARFALRKLVNILMGGGINDLWLPSFICREAVEPLKTTGIRLNFYKIQENIEPDFKDIIRRVKQKSAFVLVHYFGFPNNIDKSVNFCKENNLFLIEDCAQVYNTEYSGKQLGSFGNAAIFSSRKYLPVPHGAFLLINDENIHGDFSYKNENKQNIIKLILQGIVKWLLIEAKVPVKFWYKRRAIILRHEDTPLNNDLNEAIHQYCKKMLQYFQKDTLTITSKRQENYSLLLKRLTGLPITPLFPQISKKVCPYVFPASVNRRDEILAGLRKCGIGAQYWPTLPEEIFENSFFPISNKFRNDLLLLPIHQDLSQKHIDYLADFLSLLVK